MPAPLKKSFPEEIEWKGQNAGVKEACRIVAKTQVEWDYLWRQAYRNEYPIPKTPKLPVGKMAIGIFTGSSSEPCDIKVTETNFINGVFVMRFSAEKDQSSLATVMHTPFLLKWVPGTTTPVVFREEAPVKPASWRRNDKLGL